MLKESKFSTKLKVLLKLIYIILKLNIFIDYFVKCYKNQFFRRDLFNRENILIFKMLRFNRENILIYFITFYFDRIKKNKMQQTPYFKQYYDKNNSHYEVFTPTGIASIDSCYICRFYQYFKMSHIKNGNDCLINR